MIDRACISLNNNCNLKCRYCHFQDKQNNFTCFNEGELLQIIENIHRYCNENGIFVFKLGIVGSGEPFLKKDLLFSAFKYVKDSGYNEFKIYTITNGTLLSYDDLKKLYAFKQFFTLCISLDGYEEINDYCRQNFAKVMQTVENYKLIFGGPPNINATVHAVSLKNREKLIKFFIENGLTNVTFSKLSGCFDGDLYISDEEFEEFMQYAKNSGINSRQFNGKKTYDCTMYGKLCGVGRTNIFIAPEGIYPCGRFYKNDKYLLGKFNAPVAEIEEKLKKLTPVADGKCYYKIHLEGKR